MITKKNTSKLLFAFLSLHLLIWTLVPSTSNLNLPLDTIEALAWGSNLDWGFNKHPPFSAFAVELFYQVFGKQDWAYYFLSQAFVVASFIIIFKFANDFFNDRKLAFLSILLLEGIFFYNFTSPEFNVNISQMPFWAFSIFFTWRCVKYNKPTDYVFLGIFIGLGILSKYLFIYLVLGIKLFFIYLIFKGKKIKYIHLLITSFVALAVIFPHLLWLVENDYKTIFYGLQRTGGPGTFLDHLYFPISFLIKQIIILIPLILMVFFLFRSFKIKLNLKDQKNIFLLFTILVPIILIFLTSVIMGVKIRTMWMSPFYLGVGVLIVYFLQTAKLKINLKKFYFISIFFLLLSPTIYLSVSLINDEKRTDFPGGEIARLVQNKWDQNFNNKINIVIGDEWYAGNLSYHLSSRPKWMQSLSKSSDIGVNEGVIYTGNPKILKEVCPGVFGEIRPVGYCMIGQK